MIFALLKLNMDRKSDIGWIKHEINKRESLLWFEFYSIFCATRVYALAVSWSVILPLDNAASLAFLDVLYTFYTSAPYTIAWLTFFIIIIPPAFPHATLAILYRAMFSFAPF